MNDILLDLRKEIKLKLKEKEIENIGDMLF